MAFDSSTDKFLAFFRPQVLAQYREQPDKYVCKTDDFEGHLTLTGDFYDRLDEPGRSREGIDIGFGFRALRNGETCIAVFQYQLFRNSNGHVERWVPFIVESGDWVDYDADERFSRWFRRYAEGNWDVDNGPSAQLMHEIGLVNAVTSETLGLPLYDVGDDPPLPYPGSENTWQYEDAHRHLYGILIDGLQMPCIRALATHLGRSLAPGAARTLNALRTALPTLDTDTAFTATVKNVSDQRGKAAHKVRPPARPMTAFATFASDVADCAACLRQLRSTLESELGMSAEKCRRRQDALTLLPNIVRPPEAHFAINNARMIAGRTVERVEVGFRKEIEGVHQSEAIIVRFTDGSILGIDTGSNAANVACEHHRPDDFHVDLNVWFVPPAK